MLKPHNRPHRVRTFHQENGMMRFIDKVFDTLAGAVEYVEDAVCHSFKVFDEDDQPVHSGSHDKHCQHDHDTYA